jgi:hypothetical protein
VKIGHYRFGEPPGSREQLAGHIGWIPDCPSKLLQHRSMDALLSGIRLGKITNVFADLLQMRSGRQRHRDPVEPAVHRLGQPFDAGLVDLDEPHHLHRARPF